MTPAKNPRARGTTAPRRAPRLRGILTQRPLEPAGVVPELLARSLSGHPFLYRKMVARPPAEGGAEPGDLVRVVDKHGEPVGHGLYNPRSKIAVRLLTRGEQPADGDWWRQRLSEAVALRRDLLGLDAVTDAYRVVHAEADGLPGLVADRFGDVLSVEVFSLGIFQRIEALVAELGRLLGTKHSLVCADANVQAREGFRSSSMPSDQLPDAVTIREHGLRFGVDLQEGHKTGFFCDQRDNRRRLGELVEGRRVLDLCCYTGGFAVRAAVAGARAVTAVDLDEKALVTARVNASRNRARVSFQHADAFDYLRARIAAGDTFDAVVLDPPKLIRSRDELATGRRRYFDLNALALRVVRPGGLLLTCSCSGLLQEDEFVRLVHAAARQGEGGDARVLRTLARTGAAADHPVTLECPETSYLKALWLQVG